jgi:exopolysaccharide biosynthesis WecB/TagA/CpsF family protein
MQFESLHPRINSRRHDLIRSESYTGLGLNRPIAAILCLLCLPIFLVNSLIGLLRAQPICKQVQTKDCLNRTINFQHFNFGIMKYTAVLWAVLDGRLSFCGLPMDCELDHLKRLNLYKFKYIPPGLIDAVNLHQSSGLAITDEDKLLEQQFSGNTMDYLSLLLRGALGQLLFKNKTSLLNTPSKFSLFGLEINNDSMQEAINWALQTSLNAQTNQPCKLGCFVNVNSVNLSIKYPQLKTSINKIDRVFADGSGLRLAAKTLGVRIKENVNGTDMLPGLCKAAIADGASIYLLGAKPGVAQATADNLKAQYSELDIAGTAHGYFAKDQQSSVIEEINQSNADILLVAMGSPDQEQWLVENAPLIRCRTALAVGGLFDFYSGNIARAPMWMRELGLEWVWRLIQEPTTKFNRYLIGNPLFLIRTYLLNQAEDFSDE